jgi:hypothetical protein
MKVSNISQTAKDGVRELSADVLFETENVVEHMFIRVPDTGIPNPCPADTFFVAQVLPAMALDERLYIDSPVSIDVYTAVMKYTVPVIRNWYPRLPEPQLEIEFAESAPATSGKVCSLFSGGIDSLHTLLERKEEIDALIHMRGFETDLENDLIWTAAHDGVRETTAAFGKEVVEIKSNMMYRTQLHTGYRDCFDWQDFRGQAWAGHYWAAVGLALRPFASRLLIPSSYDYITVRVGTHPLIEPRLSAASLQIEIAGMPLSRSEKLMDIHQGYPEFIHNLRVCTEELYWSYSGALNCGCCMKCVRTQIELRLIGVENPTEPFDWPLDLAILKYFRPTFLTEHWQAAERQAKAQGNIELAKAIKAFRTRPYWRQKLRKFEFRLRKRFLPKNLRPSWCSPDWMMSPNPSVVDSPDDS